MPESKKIAFLCVDDEFSKFIYNAINPNWEIQMVIVEDHQSAKKLIKRRIKKLGWFKVTGQVLFRLLKVPSLKRAARSRVEEIRKIYSLSEKEIPETKTHKLSTVNSEKCRALLKELKPELIIINGTRIISEQTLNCVSAKFINLHVGITPKYRGVHGGYWAIKNNDPEHFGVTLHFVDEGIDTGKVISQKVIPTKAEDNYHSYPYLQIAEGIELMKNKLVDILSGKEVNTDPITTQSKIWSHPTLF